MISSAQNNIAEAPTIDSYIIEITKESEEKKQRPFSPTESREDLKRFLYNLTIKYGLDYDRMDKVIMCESSWKINPPYNGVSLGIAQFTKPTWEDYCVSDFGKYENANPYSQLECMAKMWNMGLRKRWDCDRLLTTK